MNATSIAIPGQPLGATFQYHGGPGTYIQDSHLFASIIGPIIVDEPPAPQRPNDGSKLSASVGEKGARQASSPSLPILSIQRSTQSTSGKDAALTNVLPEVDAVVLARVTRINPRQATVAILVVGETVCSDEFQGTIRVQDVRATEKDKVKIFSSFRPGDIVRAQVISLGDQSSYYLSTAGNHLGVVMATSDGGNAMYPISWKEFKDPVTGATESRKVAKPF